MKASEYLAAARNEIENGWVQGTIRNNEGVCALGAIDNVARQQQPATLDDYTRITQAGSGAAKALEMLAKEFGTTSIPDYNDRMGRTKEDVLNWFDKAIIGLEERGE